MNLMEEGTGSFVQQVGSGGGGTGGLPLPPQDNAVTGLKLVDQNGPTTEREENRTSQIDIGQTTQQHQESIIAAHSNGGSSSSAGGSGQGGAGVNIPHRMNGPQMNDFPDRPYASCREAIRANDIEAIAPFLQADNFNPDERGDSNKT